MSHCYRQDQADRPGGMDLLSRAPRDQLAARPPWPPANSPCPQAWVGQLGYGYAPYGDGVSAERAELERLIRQIPDDQVPLALAEMRRHLRPLKDRPWPPAFFASAPGDGTSIAETAGELLREGFGR